MLATEPATYSHQCWLILMQAGPLTYAAAWPTTSCIYAGNNMLLLLFSIYIIPHWRNVIFLSSKNYHLFLLLRVKNLNLSCDRLTSQVTLSSTTRWGWEVYAICWYINGHIYFFQFICDFLTSCLVTQFQLEYSTVGPVRLWSAQS